MEEEEEEAGWKAALECQQERSSVDGLVCIGVFGGD